MSPALVGSITGASDGLSVMDETTSWTFVESISSERIGVVIFSVVVAFLVVVVVVVDVTVVVADFSVVVVGDADVATFDEVTTVVVVLFGGIPVPVAFPTPILKLFVTQSSNSCFLSSSLKYVKPVQVKVINSDKLGQMNKKLKRAYTDCMNYQDY